MAVRDGKFVKVRYSVPVRREKSAAADEFVARLMAAQGRGAARPGPPVVGPGTPESRAMRVRAAPAPLA